MPAYVSQGQELRVLNLVVGVGDGQVWNRCIA